MNRWWSTIICAEGDKSIALLHGPDSDRQETLCEIGGPIEDGGVAAVIVSDSSTRKTVLRVGTVHQVEAGFVLRPVDNTIPGQIFSGEARKCAAVLGPVWLSVKFTGPHIGTGLVPLAPAEWRLT